MCVFLLFLNRVFIRFCLVFKSFYSFFWVLYVFLNEFCLVILVVFVVVVADVVYESTTKTR